jgi:hypothetical protein
MTWRQLFTQRMAARIASKRTPAAAVPAPARSDYLIGFELSNSNDTPRTLLHASTQELDPAHQQTLCSADALTSPAFGWDGQYEGTNLQVSLLLIRKSDSKVFVLSDLITMDDGDEGSSWFNEYLYVDAVPALGDDQKYCTELCLTVNDEAVEHCSGKGPPKWETHLTRGEPHGHRPAGHRCPCGHLTTEGQAVTLRGWSLRVEDPSAYGTGEDQGIGSVDDLLRLVEGSGAAHRWA